MGFREKIYHLTNQEKQDTLFERVYNILMIAAIIASILPLCFSDRYPVFRVIELVTVSIFMVDYILRWMTADYHLGGRKALAFIRYPFTPMAIIDLLSILPVLTLMNNGFRTLRLFRLVGSLRFVRAFKVVRYSENVRVITRVVSKQKGYLFTVFGFATGYVIISGLVMFQTEPETFDTLFDAIYWATITLTTIGYGDILAVSPEGKVITMISALAGIAIVTLPMGIITAGYINELKSVKKDDALEMTAGRRLKIMRLDRGYTLDEVAEKAGISGETLEKYENDSEGVLTEEELKPFCEIFDCSLLWLTGLSDDIEGVRER